MGDRFPVGDVCLAYDHLGTGLLEGFELGRGLACGATPACQGQVTCAALHHPAGDQQTQPPQAATDEVGSVAGKGQPTPGAIAGLMHRAESLRAHEPCHIAVFPAQGHLVLPIRR